MDEPQAPPEGPHGPFVSRAMLADVVAFGPFCLHTRGRRLERDQQPIRIGSRALDILIALIRRAGEVVRKEDLISQVWPDTAVEESALRMHVSGLRKLLRDGQDGARYITNVTGRGYCFVGDVAAVNQLMRVATAAPIVRKHSLPRRPARIIGRDGVAAVAGNDDANRERAIDILGSLVEKSLVSVDVRAREWPSQLVAASLRGLMT